MLRRLTLAALALAVAVTAAAFAMARGQGSPAGWAEICAGAGTVMVALDAEGNPTGPAHICPDAVLFVADGVPPALSGRPEGAARALLPIAAAHAAGRALPPARARDPPARA